MATKLRAAHAVASGSVAKAAPTFEEIFVRNDAVSLCLLLNRRGRTMRVIDFRAGASPAKKVFVQSIARRERVDKVVVLVERDECANWARLGFVREGNIPGFYKRSDAFIMGYVVPAPTAPVEERAGTKPRGAESGVFSIGRHTLFQESSEDDADEEPPAPAQSAIAEKTVTAARKLARDMANAPRVAVKLAPASAGDVQKRVAVAAKEGRALTGFEPFGRDVSRDDLVISAKGMPELVIGAEVQRCYGNAFLEVLTAPRDDRERGFLISALEATCARLLAAEIVCAFGLSPVNDVKMATAFAAAGFRRTGLLRQHMRTKGDGRIDAILWSRKLANPSGEE
jgi:hypothetical protein